MNAINLKATLEIAAVAVTLLGTAAWAAPLSPATLRVIPASVHQIISVDYGTAKKSASAMALKAQALPENLRAFESALKDIGINPDKDLESLTFVSVGNEKDGFTMVALASGSFSSKLVLKQTELQKVRAVKYYDCDVYAMPLKPVPSTSTSRESKLHPMNMTFLADNTLLFGDDSALRAVVNTRAGNTGTIESDRNFMDSIFSVEEAPVWSALDQQGAQNMLLEAMGDDANKLVGYQGIKNMVLSSRYSVKFDEGVKLDLHILTQDSDISAGLASLLKAGVLYRKVTKTAAQRDALENMTVTSEHSDLQMQFKADPKQFQNLLRTRYFGALSGEQRPESSSGTTTALVAGSAH